MLYGGIAAAERGTTALGGRPTATDEPPVAATEFDDVTAAWPVAVASPEVVAPSRWEGRYRLLAMLGDGLAAAVAAVLAYVTRFNLEADLATNAVTKGFVILLPAAWVVAAAANRAYDTRFAGFGTGEFERLARAFLYLVAITALASYALKLDLARGLILVALPLTLLFSCWARLVGRVVLRRLRRNDRTMTAVVVVGAPTRIMDFADDVRRDGNAGFKVVGACVPAPHPRLGDDARVLAQQGIPLFGCADEIRQAVLQTGARRVVVLPDGLRDDDLRTLAWDLEETPADLVVAPGLTGIAGRRLHVEPVAGSAMLFLDEPTFTGFRKFLKGAMDRVLAAAALVLLSPLLLAVAALVRFSSRGPTLFRQTRIGRDGRPFKMVKFRSMYADAEKKLAQLAGENQHGADGVLFKIAEDPRVTRVGRVIRRYSIDELPQLINVLTGTMSLVGPRPPLPREVERYEEPTHRRLRVKPGLTGLWQVSGRSDLSWQESVRLDLHYVENWSLALDFAVLARTVRAVIRPNGAY